ncbi:hypothetical protein FSARC_12298 [Fusarium sarcochroum]|uniref:Uncharacterized protein n=1 Tax=Fusarium sarcochroum TaxID=1208366 RepID=A0A8H4T9M0_9HYPO|nr:hypothetical protein FSARC_12298 [Fusarium sarcochroum]
MASPGRPSGPPDSSGSRGTSDRKPNSPASTSTGRSGPPTQGPGLSGSPSTGRPVFSAPGSNFRPQALTSSSQAPHASNPFVPQMGRGSPFGRLTGPPGSGISIEFEDDEGKWKTRYLKQEAFSVFPAKIKLMKPSDFGDELNHLELGWLHAIEILAALLNWRWPSENVLSKRVGFPTVAGFGSMISTFLISVLS